MFWFRNSHVNQGPQHPVFVIYFNICLYFGYIFARSLWQLLLLYKDTLKMFWNIHHIVPSACWRDDGRKTFINVTLPIQEQIVYKLYKFQRHAGM
jgi:hypothetical protein